MSIFEKQRQSGGSYQSVDTKPNNKEEIIMKVKSKTIPEADTD